MSLTSLSNKTVSIERLALAADDWGGQTESHSEVAKAKCRINPVSGQDAIHHAMPDMRISHRLYFPGKPSIKSGDRFKYGSRYFYVQVIRDIDELGRFLTVDCEERDG